MCTRRASTRWATCPCDGCRRLAARTTKSARLGLLPASRSNEAWKEIDRLLDRGWSTAAIASASRVALPTIDNAIRLREQTGRASTFHYGTAERILTHGEPTRGEISAEGSRRRLRALAVMGWTLGAISERSGLHRRTLSAVRSNDAEHVKAETAAAIASLFDQIGMEAGGSEVIARDARARGWMGPLAWDDIDDLHETGNLGPREPGSLSLHEPGNLGEESVDLVAVERAVTGRGAAQGAGPQLRMPEREAAIIALARHGYSDGEIASRVGVSARTVLRRRHKLGIPARAA